MKRNSRLVLSLSSFIVFLIILIAIIIKTPSADLIISQHAKNLWGSFNLFFIFLGNYSGDIMIAFALIAAEILYFQRRGKSSVILLSGLFSGYVLEEIFKLIVKRTRPAMQLVSESDYSFPSGHSIFSIILFSLLIYFYKDEIKNKFLRIVFVSVNVFFILLIGFSRIYLNVHWFTDVIGGYALGFFVVCLAIFIFESKKRK